jgi:hypothetical protein
MIGTPVRMKIPVKKGIILQIDLKKFKALKDNALDDDLFEIPR